MSAFSMRYISRNCHGHKINPPPNFHPQKPRPREGTLHPLLCVLQADGQEPSWVAEDIGYGCKYVKLELAAAVDAKSSQKPSEPTLPLDTGMEDGLEREGKGRPEKEGDKVRSNKSKEQSEEGKGRNRNKE